LAAQENKARPQAWFSRPDSHPRRPAGFKTPPSQGAPKTGDGEMIPRKYLIPLRKEFLRIKREGKFISAPLFDVLVAKNNLSYPRFAIIVGKKNFKLSVVRHQIKRRMAEAIQKIKFPNKDYVFIVQKQAQKYDIGDFIFN
jgi:ribonuclease P protein component